MTNKIYKIFKKGSRTYFYSSLFFPKVIRDDVFKLYAFVRVADDYVDSVPQRGGEFKDFVAKFLRVWEGEKIKDEVIDGFVEMAKRRGFEKQWVDAFLEAMDSDLRTRVVYRTEADLLKYIYGSAEVVGLMMSKILINHQETKDKIQMEQCAKMLGRAMQYVNFIRDVNEDIGLGRQYLPGLPDKGDSNHDEYIRAQIDKYMKWEEEARLGFKFIPKRYLLPIKTADAMYRWTASEIYRNPKIVYKKKVKPSVTRILWTVIFSK